MNDADPEIKRKAADLKRSDEADPAQHDANAERLHLDEKAAEIIDRAAANEHAKEDSGHE